jgi:hypothetical protein
LLADQLREASQRTQIIVATHSDTLIRFLEPSEVVILDSTEDGMTRLTRADELDLDVWLKEYSPDELWRNGRRRATFKRSSESGPAGMATPSRATRAESSAAKT